MNQEIELGWLRLTDKSELVVTSVHLFQHQNRRIFGESQTVIPRNAITAVRIGWQRSRWLAFFGTILVLTYLALTIGSIMTGPEGLVVFNLSSSTITSIQYGSLLGGIGLLVLFWFDKQTEIEIMAPTTTIGGIAKSYEEAQKFCSIFVPCMNVQPPAKKTPAKAASGSKPGDRDWQF
jgi:hypothetical protein